MILAIVKYILKALLSFAGELLVWAFCWFIAFFCYRQEESRVTGYPSQFPGKLRDHIDFPFTWAGTFDDCGDAHYYSGRMVNFSIFGWKPFHNLTDRVFESDTRAGAWYRYCARVLWLCRNPAYTLSRDLGYDQTGIEITEVQNEEHLWDAGYPNESLWTFINEYKQKGFLYQKQIHLGGQIFFEMALGYKVPWVNEKKNRAMIAHRFTIKKYPKVEPKPTK